MFQITIVVFREILEIALIVGILTAVTKSISGRIKYIYSGLVAGLIASIALAFFTDRISESFEGLGQEIFNGAILFTAATMISWTVIWMQKHARTISGELKTLSNSIVHGKKPPYTLFIVVFLTVLREGAEIVLFTYSSYISGLGIEKIALGLTIGLSFGVALGVALYFGLLKIFGKYFFIVTTWILVFLASGVMANAFGFWLNADIVPAFGNPVWDSSNFISQENYLGRILNIFLGYIDKPAGIQVIAYLTNFIFLAIGLKLAKQNGKKN